MKRSIWLLLLVYEAAGLSLYLCGSYGQPPYTLSIYTKADLLVEASVPYVYSTFLMVPAAVGCIVLLHRHPSAAEMLLYGKRSKLFLHQFAKAAAWNGVISVSYLTTLHMIGLCWEKENLNWGNARSYFTLITHTVLPHVSYAQVFLAQLCAIYIRTMIFMLIIIVCWWAFSDVLYGTAAVSGICFIESKSAAYKIILRNITADYGFWTDGKNKVIFLLVSALSAAALLTAAAKYVNGKEF